MYNMKHFWEGVAYLCFFKTYSSQLYSVGEKLELEHVPPVSTDAV